VAEPPSVNRSGRSPCTYTRSSASSDSSGACKRSARSVQGGSASFFVSSPLTILAASATQENGDKTLRYAHLFAIDHLVGTVYTTFFAVVWYIYVPHDGKRIANSAAQKAMMGGSQTGIIMDDAARTAAAMGVWQSERVFSAAVLVIGWLLKVRPLPHRSEPYWRLYPVLKD
jgi:hypothetical protein